jgi:hypothetical protein
MNKNGTDIAFLPCVEDGYEGAEKFKIVEANARLIAASPELLDALIELADHVDKLEGDRKCSAVWMRAKALIKKAKGE